MFSLLTNDDKSFINTVGEVAFFIVVIFESGVKVEAYVKGNSLEVDTMIERWVEYKNDLVCFCTTYRDERGLLLSDKRIFTIDDATDAYVSISKNPVPVIGYLQTKYLKPVEYLHWGKEMNLTLKALLITISIFVGFGSYLVAFNYYPKLVVLITLFGLFALIFKVIYDDLINNRRRGR